MDGSFVPSQSQLVYCAAMSLSALACMGWFRLRDAVAAYMSPSDLLDVVKVVCIAVAIGAALTFLATRLEEIARMAPVYCALILIAGWLGSRTFVLYASNAFGHQRPSVERMDLMVLIGADRLTSTFVRLLRTCAPASAKVVAILDERRYLVGRSVCRAPILGSASELGSVIDEFSVHGVDVTRVVLSDSPLPPAVLQGVLDLCAARGIECDTIAHTASEYLAAASRSEPTPVGSTPSPSLPAGYLVVKRAFDLTVSAAALLVLAPLMLFVSAMIYLEGGGPVLFWQRRVGRHGGSFMLYKFRTLRPPFDRAGRELTSKQRLSATGSFLRALHLDELPQLFNVLNGDMSIVGPRPLLEIDQPKNRAMRLKVRPGMTGWAQLNGGKSISPTEKGVLDDWYVRHLSLALDMRIILLTALRVVRGGSPEVWVGDAARVPVDLAK